MANLLSFGLNILADAFYPKYCIGCKRSGSYLCKFCVDQVSILERTFCVVCNKISSNGFTHADCQTPYAPDRLICALDYRDSTVSDMIITGKYHFIPEIFTILGSLTAHELLQNHVPFPEENLADFVVCSIPLHKQRQRWRGFNQTEIAGKIIAQALNLCCENVLVRNKNTKTQKDLNSKERKTNIANAFVCQYQPAKKIILIDDVTTTGQTFLEACRILKQNGAQEVWCVSIAKD